MNKKGQLGFIEGKFFLFGLLIGIVLAIALVALGSHGVLPFKIPWVCG